MSSAYNQTNEYLYNLIDSGSRSFNSLTKDQRKELISIYIKEAVADGDAIFEDSQPTAAAIGAFIMQPTSKVNAELLAKDILECIFLDHQNRLEALFDEAYEKFMDECVNQLSELEEHRVTDNRERVTDINESLYSMHRGY